MKCPFCNSMDDMVVDSRPLDDGFVIRRRRECSACQKRYTTYERVEVLPLTVLKKDGSKENFDRSKVRQGLMTACRKRPISLELIERLLNQAEGELQEIGREISSAMIGDKIMEKLRGIDDVAYLRFASVYKDFNNLEIFFSEIQDIVKNKEGDLK